ncbi:hypothetical protein CDAR_108841 [Caerostris darwini]|uniref:Abnormal spindle-like microcephaly-associated protein n=1 Tax=Caerostris darwini TaxID=1538125 RepID=A0AAV4R830_9ARAC|nr:hypothetical protein CDAR_108841 [Caerostris darwini]
MSNDEVRFGATEINLNALRVAGDEHFDLPESCVSTSPDLDQLITWTNFQRRLTNVRDTPVIESPLQIDTISSTSVMTSKLENCLGSLVETTTTLAEASPVPVQPQKCFNQPRKIFRLVEITNNLTEASPVPVQPENCFNQPRKIFRLVEITANLAEASSVPFQPENCCNQSMKMFHLVEITTNLAEASSVPLQPENCSNQTRKMFHLVEIPANLAEASSLPVQPENCSKRP